MLTNEMHNLLCTRNLMKQEKQSGAGFEMKKYLLNSPRNLSVRDIFVNSKCVICFPLDVHKCILKHLNLHFDRIQILSCTLRIYLYFKIII